MARLFAIFSKHRTGQHRITGWRQRQKAFGKPDFVFRSARLTVFVDGCFWHLALKHCKIPAGNRGFWKKKFAANRARDRRVNRELRQLGWRVLRFWEHALAQQPAACVQRIQSALNSARAAAQ